MQEKIKTAIYSLFFYLCFFSLSTLHTAEEGSSTCQEVASPMVTGTTTQAIVNAFEQMRFKFSNLILISRADVLAANEDYKEIFRKEERKDHDLAKIFEERYRLACKKVEPTLNKAEASLKSYEKAKERLEKIQKEKDELESIQKRNQADLHSCLNELSSIYWLELDQARMTTEQIRKKAQASHQPIKKIVEEEIRILHKGR